MRRGKAWRKIRRKLARAKTCPFCGGHPEFKVYTVERKSGAMAHVAHREGCCRATCMGQTELFFTQPDRSPDYGLWWWIACKLIDDWNERRGQ